MDDDAVDVSRERAIDAVDVSRERTSDAVEQLERRFGSVPTIDRRWTLDDDTYAEYVERVERGTLGGAGAWVVDGIGRVLFVRETDRTAWSEPSGHHEPGETLAETARRETREETGLTVELDGVGFLQRVLIVPPTGSPHDPIHRLIAVFTATLASDVDPDGVDPRDGEIEEACWFDRHPDPLLYDELERLEIPAAVDS